MLYNYIVCNPSFKIIEKKSFPLFYSVERANYSVLSLLIVKHFEQCNKEIGKRFFSVNKDEFTVHFFPLDDNGKICDGYENIKEEFILNNKNEITCDLFYADKISNELIMNTMMFFDWKQLKIDNIDTLHRLSLIYPLNCLIKNYEGKDFNNLCIYTLTSIINEVTRVSGYPKDTAIKIYTEIFSLTFSRKKLAAIYKKYVTVS